MKTTLLVALLAFHLFNAVAYNLATDHYLVYENPGEVEALFGLSVVLHGGRNLNESWIQIGAPSRIAAKTQHSSLYRCNIGKSCRTLRIETTESRNDGWLGSAMDINEGKNTTVVCEPLAKKRYKGKYLSGDLFVIGACYLMDFNGHVTETLRPLDDPDNIYLDSIKRLPYFYGLGEFGFSARFTNKSEDADMIFGAPGMLNWIGYPLKSERGRIIVGDKDDFLRSKKSVLRSYAYIGYSTAAGHFSDDCRNCFAYSAPKSADTKGTVLILDHNFNLIQLLNGEQMGEYFGASLMAGDINRDGYDDLIVGSPSFRTFAYSEGCIHLFLGTHKQLRKSQSICISKQGAQFGTAISYLSDLDKDGYGDVAVGAPYEDNGRGAVYIYNGGPNGLISKPSQIISAGDIYESLRGFGYSISNPADVDANGYSDITVGAYQSGHVVVLQSKPIVTVYQSLKSLTTLNSTSKFVDVQVCFRYTAKNFNKTLRISSNISIEETDIWLERDLPQYLSIRSDKTQCKNVTLKIHKNKHTNIHLKLMSAVINRPTSLSVLVINGSKGQEFTRSLFCDDCVVNNRTHSTVTDLYIPFNLHCNNSEICYANFYTKSSWVDIKKNLILVGARESISLTIRAINSGENAYLAKIEVKVPSYVQFGMIPTVCELGDSKLFCEVGDPLQNTTKTVLNDLELDLEAINKGVFVENFNVTVTARTESKNLADNEEVIPLRLTYAGTISITRQTSESLAVAYDENSKTLQFNNAYKIENLGPSPVASALVSFLIPISVKESHNTFLKVATLDDFTENNNLKCTLSNSLNETSKKDTYVEMNRPYELNFTNRTLLLDCSQERTVCTEITCITGPLAKRDYLVVPFQINFSSTALEDTLDDRNIIVIAVDASVSVKEPRNYVKLGNSSAIRTYNVVSGETRRDFVETWIVIAATIIGFIFLIFLTLGLWKLGFFERAKKKQLEHEKEVMLQNEFYGYLGAIPSVQKEFINPNGLLRDRNND